LVGTRARVDADPRPLRLRKPIEHPVVQINELLQPLRFYLDGIRDCGGDRLCVA
jgi:hypothetical protein